MKRKLNAIDWKELFHGKDVNLSWKTFLKLLNNIILKYTSRFAFNNKRKKSIWMNSQAFSKVQLKNRAYHQFYALKIIMTTIFTSNTEVRQQEHVVKLCPIMNILYLKR